MKKNKYRFFYHHHYLSLITVTFHPWFSLLIPLCIPSAYPFLKRYPLLVKKVIVVKMKQRDGLKRRVFISFRYHLQFYFFFELSDIFLDDRVCMSYLADGFKGYKFEFGVGVFVSHIGYIILFEGLRVITIVGYRIILLLYHCSSRIFFRGLSALVCIQVVYHIFIR